LRAWSAISSRIANARDPRPWKNSAETPNFVALVWIPAEDIRGGLGYQGLPISSASFAEGGLVIARANQRRSFVLR